MTSAHQLGKYRLVRRIGVGGMAEVFEATLEGPGGFTKRLALKQLLPDRARDPKAVEMFIDEATIAAALDHPNIVHVQDFGEIDGCYFMAMEYVDGWDLRQLQLRAEAADRPFPVSAAAFVVRDLCRGLDFIHHSDRQVVHRDVTPHNVFVTRQGGVKLGDFGIAKSVGRLAVTEDGQIKGKLSYLAPEQVTGEPITPRTDVYAAGLILYELLCGRRLITAEREVDLLLVAKRPPWPDLAMYRPEATELQEVLAQALAPTPTLRQGSAGLLAADLDRFVKQAGFDAEDLAAFVIDQLHQDGTAKAAEKQNDPIAAFGPTVSVPSPPGDHLAPLGRRAEDDTNAVPNPRGPSTRPSPNDHLVPLGRRAAVDVQTRALRPKAEPSPPATRRIRLALYALAPVGVAVLVALLWNPSPSQTPPSESVDAAIPTPVIASVAVDAAHAARKPLDQRAGSLETSSNERPQPIRPRPRPRRKSQPGPSKIHPADKDPVAAKPAESPEPERIAQLKEQLRSSSRLARSRGLWPGDDPRHDRLVKQVREVLAAGQLKTATATLRQLQRRVEAFHISRDFAEKKLDRLSWAIDRAPLPKQRRKALATESQNVLRLIMGGHLVEASRVMSKIRARLR